MRASRFVALGGGMALLLAGFLAAPQTVRADGAESIKIVKLLGDTRATAVQLKDDAATMQSLSQLDTKWEAHAATVARMRQHVIAMEKEVAQLKAGENESAPWEKAVIDRIEPYMSTLAEDNEAVMDAFGQHPSLFGTPAANAYLTANANSAAYLAALIVNVVENGTLRQTIQDYGQPQDSCAIVQESGPMS